ncbi:MAG: hypothetical protein EZS28_032386, partial [Streblomastix strix]
YGELWCKIDYYSYNTFIYATEVSAFQALQVSPIINGTFNEGIRIARNPANLWSNIQFGCDPNSDVGYIDGQWLIGSTGNNGVNPLGFIIVKAGQEGTINGLQINQYGNVLNFNGMMTSGNIQINSTATGYDDGLRISRADPTGTGNSSIQLGFSRTSTTGAIVGQWSIFTPPSSSTNNPQIIAGTGAQSGASNGSVNYSAGNPILWGLNSVDTNGGFYSNGSNIYWRARPITLGSVPP